MMLSMKEAASYIGMSYKTLMANYRYWQIPFYKISNKVLFAESELDEWLESHHHKAA